MNSAVRTWCAVAVLVVMSGVASAKVTDIGKAEVVVPDAKRTSIDQDERTLQVGTDVFKDDIVATGNIGAVMLQFNDKTTLKIFPNSKVKLDNYVYDADKTVLRVGLNLLSGAMRIASGGPHTADKYQLRTPQATIGIRGTVIHIVSDSQRTVVEALHGTFHACATSGSACQTVSATDSMNALRLGNDGRIELARARRDLGVRSAHGSSDASATQSAQLGSAIATVESIDGRAQAGLDASPPIPGAMSQSPRLNAPDAALSSVNPSTATVTTGGQGTAAASNLSGRSSGDPFAPSSAQNGTSPSSGDGPGSSVLSLGDLFFGPNAGSEPSHDYSGGPNSGGAPETELNAIFSIVITGSTVAFLRRKRNKSTIDF